MPKKSREELKEIVGEMRKNGSGPIHCFVLARNWDGAGKGEFLSELSKLNVIFEEKYCRVGKAIVWMDLLLMSGGCKVIWRSAADIDDERSIELTKAMILGKKIDKMGAREKPVKIVFEGGK